MLKFRRYFAALIVVLFVAGCQSKGVFHPLPPTPVPAGTISNLVLPITFPNLQADPAGYVNQLIRVTGLFTSLPTDDCPYQRGPQSGWALIADNLRMDMVGFEELLKLLPADTLITVDGYWEQYRGPLGCGKEPPAGTAWYLQVVRIVQPNPLPAFEIIVDNGNPLFLATLPAVIGEVPLTDLPTPTPQPTFSSTIPVTLILTTTSQSGATTIVSTPAVSPSATSTIPAGATPLATNTPLSLPGPTSAATTPAPTITLTPTPTPSTTLPPNPQPTNSPAPPGPTSPPPPYPSPQPTGYP